MKAAVPKTVGSQACRRVCLTGAKAALKPADAAARYVCATGACAEIPGNYEGPALPMVAATVWRPRHFLRARAARRQDDGRFTVAQCKR